MELAGKWVLGAVQLVGLLLSGMLVIYTFTSPDQIELRLQKYVVVEVEEAVDAALDEAQRNILDRAERLGALAERLGVEADRIDALSEKVVPALLAIDILNRCEPDCDFWEDAVKLTESALVQRAANLRIGEVSLRDYTHERYNETLAGLIRDLRRFGMVNVIVLSLMLGLTLFRNYVGGQFAVFSVAMTGYILWSSYEYVYKQDWAFAILFQDWAATGYQSAMIFVACMFFDWLFLGGAITQHVVEAVLKAVAVFFPA